MTSRDHYIAPCQDAAVDTALDQAIATLAAARNMNASDAAAHLHLITSLKARLDTRTTQAVHTAKADGLSWAEIADLLGTTRAAAWQRFNHQP